ncbi:conserved protein of unknown function(Domain of unknown function DUF58,54-138) [Magnetospirillum sp. XM-1]|uniref:DUF58 domain-containing protein n=1 Tax=Magnetospirillum sp. XM-1 TaxID=1663591 RepID=UPI00073DD8CA|nr:DUF58 domain-containing protein [Magnetospirillum sp. XM-1]CUW38561.1 conserved protein of unknown function(Domain of unknown function DUF58,54-138) [Magnetospirillum sp. XM-1]
MTGKASTRAKSGELPELRAEELASRFPPLLVEAERVAQSVAQGVHGRRRAGSGDSFWQYRRAQPGDGAGSIDWRRSARSDHLYVRETEWAASQTVWLWLDGSPSMRWRSDTGLPTKHARASLLVLALAALLLRGGERVACLTGEAPPCWGSGALGRLALALERAGDAPLSPPARLPRHATLVLAGDFLDPLDDVAAHIESLAQAGASGHLLQVLDPAEESLPYAGRLRFLGLEGEGELETGRAEDLRAAYQERLAARRDALSALARSLGWSFATHRTDRPAAPCLLALAQKVGGLAP